MRILVAYLSQTGNTEQVARAIGEAVSSRGHQVDLRAAGEIAAQALNRYDLVYLGSACHDTDLARPVQRLLAEIDDSPPFRLAGFVTHATQMPDQEGRARELYDRWAGNCVRTFRRASAGKQIPFLGYFHCQGAPSPPIEAFIHHTILTDRDEWETYLAQVRAHPTEEDLQRAREYARQVLDSC